MDNCVTARPNLGGKARWGYVLVGAGIALWGLVGAEAAWARVSLLGLGGVLIVEGTIGF